MRRILVVTGTDTGVGKTVTTAALAAAFIAGGARVHVDKPVQTGVLEDEPGDMGEIVRLAGLSVGTTEGIRVGEPMAPVPAAVIANRSLPRMAAQLERLHSLAAATDVLLVEGAGGLLVHLDAEGASIADLAAGLGAPLVVVVRAGLGTLNHTELTLEAIANRGLPVAGLVIGSWPADAGVIERTNRRHLAGLDVPLLGAVPAGAGGLAPSEFQRLAPGWFTNSQARLLTLSLGSTTKVTSECR